jgi:ABC-type nitrate/sulfonate/bicarbonate transport system permease component
MSDVAATTIRPLTHSKRNSPFIKRDTLLGAATIVGVLVIWEVVYRLELMPRWAFPSPVQVGYAFYELTMNGVLLTNAGASMLRQFTGVILAAAFGIPFGLWLGASPTARAALLPLCRLVYPIPGIAWIPLAILWFGIGFTSTVFVIFFSGIWPIIFNTMAGVQTLSGQYTDVARVYLAPRSLYTRRILIPGSLPFIIAGLRLTYGVGWRVIVGAEMISSIVGLGFLIDDARWQLRPDIMICGMIAIAMIGWVSENWFFDWVERRTIERWGMKANPS